MSRLVTVSNLLNVRLLCISLYQKVRVWTDTVVYRSVIIDHSNQIYNIIVCVYKNVPAQVLCTEMSHAWLQVLDKKHYCTVLYQLPRLAKWFQNKKRKKNFLYITNYDYWQETVFQLHLYDELTYNASITPWNIPVQVANFGH